MTDIQRVLVKGMKKLLPFGRLAASTERPLQDHRLIPFRPRSEMRLMAITASAREQDTLRVIAVEQGWKLLVAESVRAALNILRVEPVPLLFYDRDLPGIEWPDMFRILHSALEPPCVVLMSPVTDDYLWHAVIERGGYDVLTKPLQEDKVVNVVHQAWLYQKTGWSQPHPAFRVSR